MISASRVIKTSLEHTFTANNSSSGGFHKFAVGQGATGPSKTAIETSWLNLKGGSGKNLGELWGTYLTSKSVAAGPIKDRMKAFFLTGTQS